MWIEVKGEMLINLNNVQTVNLFERTVRFWIISETVPYDEIFDTEQQAQARYNEIKALLVSEEEIKPGGSA